MLGNKELKSKSKPMDTSVMKEVLSKKGEKEDQGKMKVKRTAKRMRE